MKNTPTKIVAATLFVACVLGMAVLMNDNGNGDNDYYNYHHIHSGENTTKIDTVINKVNEEAVQANDDSVGEESGPGDIPQLPGIPTGAPGTVTDHGHVAFRQSQYSDMISGSTTISRGGCGWCSLSAMMTELDSNCKTKTPVDWLSEVSDTVKGNWSGGSMGWNAPKDWVDWLNSVGTYGTYELVASSTSTDTGTVINKIEQYTQMNNTVCVVSCAPGLFTSGGHIILIPCVFEEEGVKYFHVTDSSGVASSKLGVEWPGGCNVSYPLNATNLQGNNYSFKCVWVIRKVS